MHVIIPYMFDCWVHFLLLKSSMMRHVTCRGTVHMPPLLNNFTTRMLHAKCLVFTMGSTKQQSADNCVATFCRKWFRVTSKNRQLPIKLAQK